MDIRSQVMTIKWYISLRKGSSLAHKWRLLEISGWSLFPSVRQVFFSSCLICSETSFFIVRFLPGWFPGAGFKRFAKNAGKELSRIECIPFDWAKKTIVSRFCPLSSQFGEDELVNQSDGDYVESFISKHLRLEDGHFAEGDIQEYVKWCSAALYVGGGDTVSYVFVLMREISFLNVSIQTVSALTTFFLVMALYPNVQSRAQAEIDRLISDRLPTLDDCDSLPYITAIIKEVIRWGPVAPLGKGFNSFHRDYSLKYDIHHRLNRFATSSDGR